MITIQAAKNLKHGTILYHVIHRNADKTPQRWKVNGMVKTWKRDKTRILIPIKHGLYNYDYLTQNDLNLVCLDENEALNQ